MAKRLHLKVYFLNHITAHFAESGFADLHIGLVTPASEHFSSQSYLSVPQAPSLILQYHLR
uniref:Uncharacterized protein n=1 Tax=Arundo donax TaxID=35708 RepID=A0A0A9FIT4_ARUDO